MSHLDKTDCQPERGKAVTVHYVLQLWAARWYIAAVITRIGWFVCAGVEATKLNALCSRFPPANTPRISGHRVRDFLPTMRIKLPLRQYMQRRVAARLVMNAINQRKGGTVMGIVVNR
jgi:hypothetical protein